MPVLRLLEIKKRFGQTVALDGVDLSLERGRVHALIGENGAGKSTLMNIISGSVVPDQGAMEMSGVPYVPADPLVARKCGIALIHQELSLVPHLSVAENILMGNEDSCFGWLDRKAIEQKAQAVLSNFDQPEIRPETPVGRLSPAARQVVEICRAVAANAAIILMDEPTSSLQREDVKRLFELIRTLKSQGTCIVYISHFLEEIREIADDFTVLRDGRSVLTGEVAGVTDSLLVSRMVGREVESLYPRRQCTARNEVLMSVVDVSAPPVLKHASFELRAGEIFGIAGLIGAGRTEMVRSIFGLDRVARGEITVSGLSESINLGSPTRRVSQGVGYLSEDRKQEGLTQSLSIADNITMTRYSACSSFGFINTGKQFKRSAELARHLDVRAENLKSRVSSLSGGNQQKVSFARLLHQSANVLLLDEPTRGIDIGSKVKIYETIADLANEGKGILMISSYLPELFGMCDRLAVMSRGTLSESRPISEWTPELVMQAAIASSRGSGESNGH